jgi:hypothetical protein
MFTEQYQVTDIEVRAYTNKNKSRLIETLRRLDNGSEEGTSI